MTAHELLAHPSELRPVNALAPEFRVSPTTLHRWRSVGVPDRNGERRLLPAVKLGNEWKTSRAAVVEFVIAISAAPVTSPAVREIDNEREM